MRDTIRSLVQSYRVLRPFAPIVPYPSQGAVLILLLAPCVGCSVAPVGSPVVGSIDSDQFVFVESGYRTCWLADAISFLKMGADWCCVGGCFNSISRVDWPGCRDRFSHVIDRIKGA
ncbi:MAG: hypothetical protein CM1200mP41_15670 [Gammaproteobacteria bacterium]|nr:MAG: hypothetical protein CM1200mP41_15670 [Gammaproteobacteria bacterium]